MGYVPPAAADARYISAVGDTMTGDLVLPGPPGNPNSAASKAYVDSHTHPSTTDFQFIYDSATTMADPGMGDVRTDTAVGVPSTQVAFSDITNLGIDCSQTLASLTTDDMIMFQQLDNAANWGRYRVSGVPTDNGTWWLVPVEGIEQHGTINKNQTVLVRFTYGTSGGGGGGGLTQEDADARYLSLADGGLVEGTTTFGNGIDLYGLAQLQQVQISDGAGTAGHVLTAVDTFGNAHWAARPDIQISATAPANPDVGDVWIDTSP